MRREIEMVSPDVNEGTIKTTCRLCRGGCGIRLHIKGGRIVRVEGDQNDPISRGYLCPKGKAIPEILNAPERLMYPLKKDGSRWKRISWEEAIDEIAEKLQKIKKEYGPYAVIIHIGHALIMQEIRPLIQRFCNIYGTPNFSSAASQCHWAKVIGNVLTYGFFPVPDIENASCIMLWGSNPSSSNPLTTKNIFKRQREGAKLIVIDPVKTLMAKKSDLYLQVRPGTDGALALGILSVIVRENLYDTDFVNKWVTGFDEIKTLLAEFPLKRVQEITGVPQSLIEKAAFLYARAYPACIIQGNALEHHTNAVQGIRAIAILQALTGNLDIRGGALMDRLAPLSDITLKEMLPANKVAIGGPEYPLFYEFTHTAQANMFAETILTDDPYPIKGFIVTGANPILTFPNAEKVRKAFEQLEFLVVMDVFMTETAKLAHMVLPAAMVFERSDLCDLGRFQPTARLVLYDKLINAPGECWPDWKLWFELARAMGYQDYFPWKDINDLFNFRLKPIGITAKELRRCGNTVAYGSEEYRRYEKNGFNTPSGKVEIYSKRMEEMGLDPLPRFEEPVGIPLNMLDLEDRYPLVLTTGARICEYIHSRFRNIASLYKRVPAPWVQIHPETAMEIGVEDGEEVSVESIRGSIRLRVRVTEKIPPRIVSIPHGWDEANVNILADDKARDPISGFPSFRSLLCRLKPTQTE